MKVAIIGAGPAGLFLAYGLSSNSACDVTLYDKGKDLEDRSCPILLSNKAEKCANCYSCSIMEGVAGAGAFSDGKYNITTEFGGWLQHIMDPEKVIAYEDAAFNILHSYGASAGAFWPNDELKKLCLQHNLIMQQSKCIHLGTDANYGVMLNMVNDLKSRPNVHLNANTEIIDCYHTSQGWIIQTIVPQDEHGPFDKVIFAVGRSGSSFFADWCNKNHVELSNRQVDIGVRVELPSEVWEDFEKKIYEPKILYKTKQYGDIVRMFCFNGRGEVVNENTDGVITVNGHAYKEESKKTKNTNFALLSSIHFTEPFDQPIAYAKYTAGLANMVSGGSVIVQTLGDLKRGRRTDASRLAKCTTKPSLKTAVPGDLSLCMPKRQLDNIIEMLDKLDEIAPGTANDDTLLYGIECKYYSARPQADENFQLLASEKFNKLDNWELEGVYGIGDGAGFTRSLAQASAQGLMLANKLLDE